MTESAKSPSLHAPTADSQPRELQLRTARAAIAKTLGADQLAKLHVENLALDLAAIFGSIALFLLLAWQLATGSASSVLWWLCLALQGNLIVVMGIINHDVFVHRKRLPTPWRWIVSSMLAWPAQLRASVYESQHMAHHRGLGTDNDTEMHKHGLDSAMRRVFYATPALLVFRALFYRGVYAKPPARAVHGGDQRVRIERNTRFVLIGLSLLTLAFDWRLLVLGYLLPLLVVSPMINTLRIVLEHFDLDARNPFWVGTFYRTGFITRPMFWWGAGDCHMVHHFYANIPFYRMPAALRLFRPILQREGVYEHRSLAPLLADWFKASRGHWSLPAHAQEQANRRAQTAAP
ncbi:fatty acid desaturase [Caenimonas sp. SL110]|uniref:fatty acid desaturase n=1 Tax=Caenimonas sp. SL110 TaxID=1450524 RepID=UPI0006546A17|nr:fatty acid desaturase [Caenimonas sp. SL110]